MPMPPAFDYRLWTVPDLKQFLDQRNIEINIIGARRTQLVALLKEADENASWPLMQFPPEIRGYIYRFVALLDDTEQYHKMTRSENTPMTTFEDGGPPTQPLELTRVSRQVRAEVMPVYLKHAEATVYLSQSNDPGTTPYVLNFRPHWLDGLSDEYIARLQCFRIVYFARNKPYRSIVVQFSERDNSFKTWCEKDNVHWLRDRGYTSESSTAVVDGNDLTNEVLEQQLSLLCKSPGIGRLTRGDFESLFSVLLMVEE